MKTQTLILFLLPLLVSWTNRTNLSSKHDADDVAVVVGTANRTGRFQRVMFGPRGDIVALDASRGKVAIFNSQGVYRKDFGSYGRDVGQFTSPVSMGWSEDNIWVFDVSENRISFASESFEISRVESLPYFKWPIETFLILRGITSARELWLEEGASPNGFARMSANGRVITMLRPNSSKLDTAANLPFQDAVFLLRFPNNALLMKAQPWARTPLFAVSPNGLHAAVVRQSLGNDTILIQRWKSDASEWLEHKLALKSNRLASADVSAAISKFLTSDLLARFANNAAAHRAVREALFIPDSYPQFTRLLLGSDGSIWLLHPDGQKTQSWVVISGDQKEIRKVSIPENIQIEDVDARARIAVGLRESGNDESTVVILRFGHR